MSIDVYTTLFDMYSITWHDLLFEFKIYIQAVSYHKLDMLATRNLSSSICICGVLSREYVIKGGESLFLVVPSGHPAWIRSKR